MFYLQEGFTYRNFLMDALAIFIFVVWFWLLITVFADLFRRHDISGWIKAIWVIALIVIPYIAILTYLIFQGRGMAERNAQQAQQARDELRRVVGFSVADEIQKLDALKKAGSISDARICKATCPADLVTANGPPPSADAASAAAIGSVTLDIPPQNGAVVARLAVCGSTDRKSYLNAIPEIGSTQTR